MARPAVPELNLNGAETASVCSDLDSGIGSCSPTSTGPACVPEHRSVQTFRSTEDYLYAMKEDLAEWLNCLYDQEMHVDNFFEKLENGVLLCDHANHVQMLADEYRDEDPNNRDKIPEKAPVYRKNVKKGTFQARDNICNFISWCKQLGVPDVILFETEDLVMRKNEKSVVLALLEVARKGAKFGMLVPCLIQLEQEIDAEIKGSPPPVKKEPPVPMVQTITCDMRSLDEMVRDLVSQCVCLPNQFPLIRLAEGKYQVGENKTLIFVRILRNHVMVRVGGGWDTLENYLNKHDPCRCSKPVTRKTSVTRPRAVSSVGPTKEGKPNVQEPKTSTPNNTPQQNRRSVTESAQSVPTRRISTPERPRPSTANPQTSTTTARRRLSLDSGGDNSTSTRSTPERSRIARSPSTEMTNPNARSTSKDRTIPQPQRSASKDRLNPNQAWAQSSPKQRSPISPERSLARSLAGSLSDIRQQSELLRQQLQEDFSDDSSMSSDISRVSEPQMSKSLDFSKVRDARRASAPSKESTPPAKSVTRRSQTPQQTPPQREQLIRRSMTPQPQSSSRVRSTPTTPVARRREVPRNASTPDRNQQSQQQPRAKTPSGAMTATLKERLNKYKQETSTLQRQQQRQHQQQQQQQAPRARRDSDKPVIRRDSASKPRSRSCQPGLAGARYKSTSLSALDTQLNLDEIEDIGGNEEMYMEMEKMFQEFKKQEIEKTEKEEARMSIEAELDRRLGQVSDKKTSLREHFNQKGGRAPGGTKTAPNTPGIQRRSSASASPSSWRENSDQIIRRGPTPKRSKTPDPVVSHDLTDSPHDPVKMCKCCSKLSELLESAPVELKPRKDDDESRPKTRIPGPATSRSTSNFRRTNSMVSLASSTDESESSDLSKTDNEIRAINKDVLSPRSRRMSAPTGEPNKMMAPLITNRSTIMKDVPRAMSPVKALREQRPASPIKAFRRQESS